LANAWARFLSGDLVRAHALAKEAMERLEPASPSWFLAAGVIGEASHRLWAPASAIAAVELMLKHQVLEGTPTVPLTRAVRDLLPTLVFSQQQALCEVLFAALKRWSSQVGDDEALGAVHSALSLEVASTGDYSLWAARVAKAAAHFTAAGDVNNATMHRVLVGFVDMELGAYERAAAALEPAIAAADRQGLNDSATLGRIKLGRALMHLGRADEGVALERTAAEASRAAGNFSGEVEAGMHRVDLHLARAEVSQAAALMDELNQVAASPMHKNVLRAHQAEVALAQGDAKAALELSVEALSQVSPLRFVPGEVRALWVRTKALGALGRAEESRASAQEAKERLHTRVSWLSEPQDRSTFLLCVPEHARVLQLES
jgi:tetratricopeptide (TPR) repeat protein